MNDYKVTVIGAGPGGYTAAIRCAQFGFKTALVEKYDKLGGTCLNVGCIPSKTLLDTSELFHQAKEKFNQHGISADNIRMDIGKMMTRKEKVIQQTGNGIKFLMKKNKLGELILLEK